MTTTQSTPSYLYGFMRTPAEPLPELVGVFGAPVLVQADGDLAAIVSPLAGIPARATRDELMAHSDVLQCLVADYDVVPASFGGVHADGFRLDALPRDDRKTIARLVAELSGRVEIQVKGQYDEAHVTLALVEGDARLKRLRASQRQSHATQLAIGTRFAEVLDRRRRSDVHTVTKRLSRIADRVALDAPMGEWGAFRLALLVARNSMEAAERVLSEVEALLAPAMDVTWIGPLPPYSFVQSGSARRRKAG